MVENLKRFFFPKNKRLVTNSQFKAVLEHNLRACDRLLTLFIAENDCGYRRLGISVGKSWGNAAVRNRLKRLLREAFRRNQGKIPDGFDYLLMISTQWSKKSDSSTEKKIIAKRLTFEQVQASFLALVTQAAAKRLQKQKTKSTDIHP